MRLSDIVLAQTTCESSIELDAFWHGKSKESLGFREHVDIVHPLAGDDNYYNLFCDFIENLYADSISFSDGKRYHKAYARKLKKRHLGEIVDVLKKNPNKLGNLELYFRTIERHEREGYLKKVLETGIDEPRIKLRFAEIERRIVSYQVTFDIRHQNFFSWTEEPILCSENIYGLWMPTSKITVQTTK